MVITLKLVIILTKNLQKNYTWQEKYDNVKKIYNGVV